MINENGGVETSKIRPPMGWSQTTSSNLESVALGSLESASGLTVDQQQAMSPLGIPLDFALLKDSTPTSTASAVSVPIFKSNSSKRSGRSKGVTGESSAGHKSKSSSSDKSKSKEGNRLSSNESESIIVATAATPVSRATLVATSSRRDTVEVPVTSHRLPSKFNPPPTEMLAAVRDHLQTGVLVDASGGNREGAGVNNGREEEQGSMVAPPVQRRLFTQIQSARQKFSPSNDRSVEKKKRTKPSEAHGNDGQDYHRMLNTPAARESVEAQVGEEAELALPPAHQPHYASQQQQHHTQVEEVMSASDHENTLPMPYDDIDAPDDDQYIAEGSQYDDPYAESQDQSNMMAPQQETSDHQGDANEEGAHEDASMMGVDHGGYITHTKRGRHVVDAEGPGTNKRRQMMHVHAQEEEAEYYEDSNQYDDASQGLRYGTQDVNGQDQHHQMQQYEPEGQDRPYLTALSTTSDRFPGPLPHLQEAQAYQDARQIKLENMVEGEESAAGINWATCSSEEFQKGGEELRGRFDACLKRVGEIIDRKAKRSAEYQAELSRHMSELTARRESIEGTFTGIKQWAAEIWRGK